MNRDRPSFLCNKNRWLLLGAMALLLFVFCSRAAGEGSVVRMHIFAHSDAPADQQIKHQVRDALAPLAEAIAQQAQDDRQLLQLLGQNLDALERCAQQAAREAGFDGPVHALWGLYPFEERELAGVRYPAGTYQTLRIELGEGRGRNWWCVLFPEIGIEGARESEELVFYSELVRWICALLGQEGAS